MRELEKFLDAERILKREIEVIKCSREIFF
jgi:hypothetical protein